jgi:hypothetical protein
MKKLIVLSMVFAMAFSVVMPVVALTEGDASSGLTRGTGGGEPPAIKVKWEMKGTVGADDSTNAGAQFNAPGTWGSNMTYKVCAIATDPNGAADITGVYADIYYPERKAIHDRVPSTDVHRDTAGGAQDVGQGGCGAFIEENTLVKMTKDAGYTLFCNNIRNNNENLPVFNEAYGPFSGMTRAQMYSEICATDGELMKETAYVYCDTKTLVWEDPAGLYTVKVFAQDQSGNNSLILQNNFEYLPLTKLAKDFTNVSYGQVLLNTDKKISGDLNFAESTPDGFPTIRNLGNTRLWVGIAQDDMGLGQSSGVYNVKFDARVGNNEKDWSPKYYPFKLKGTAGNPAPEQYMRLEDILDLSETEEIDFSILVTKWPDVAPTYNGNIWLNVTPAPFRICPAS